MHRIIYICKDFNPKRDDSRRMAKIAISDYLLRSYKKSITTTSECIVYLNKCTADLSNEIILNTSEKGKPYIKKITQTPYSQHPEYTNYINNLHYTQYPHFSISHSGEYWICAVSMEDVGIDIQKKYFLDHIKMSKRFLSSNEAQYVKNHGLEGFFEIWTRKEAVVKLFGLGFFLTKQEVVSSACVLMHDFMNNGKKYFINNIDIDEKYACAICTS